MDKENPNLTEKYKNTIDKFIEEKGYSGPLSFCAWNGTNCPSDIFNGCPERPLGEASIIADNNNDFEKLEEIDKEIDKLGPFCGLEKYLGVDCGKIQYRINEIRVK